MKLILFSVIIFSLISCSKSNNSFFIPEEFQYPNSKLNFAKDFLYVDSASGKQSRKTLELRKIDGENYLISTQYDSTVIQDSIIFHNGKIQKYFSNFEGEKLISGKSVEDTILRNGKDIGEKVCKFIFSSPTTSYNLTSEEQFLKDTSIIWQGVSLPCKETEKHILFELQSLEDSKQMGKVKALIISYYARNLGLIKYRTKFTDQAGKEYYGVFNLKE